jgi:hypothetical protein
MLNAVGQTGAQAAIQAGLVSGIIPGCGPGRGARGGVCVGGEGAEPITMNPFPCLPPITVLISQPLVTRVLLNTRRVDHTETTHNSQFNVVNVKNKSYIYIPFQLITSFYT